MATQQELQIYQPMKYWWLYFVISLAVILPGTYSLIRHGLRLGIDFTGGSTISWSSPVLNEEGIKASAGKSGVVIKEISRSGDTWKMSTDPIDRKKYQEFFTHVMDDNVDLVKDSGKVKELTFETIGPSLGAELLKKTIYGLLMAATLILLYVAYRFQNVRFGMSAILAMLHDSLVLLGIFSLLGVYLQVEVDTLFVTALLTILSFSVHDTIVVYDRIRELKKKHGSLSFEETANRAVVETMGRSINNSMTVIFMLLAMYLLGGETTKWFIFALLVGTISGTYSSPFTAVPILLVWDKLSYRAKKKKLDRKK